MALYTRLGTPRTDVDHNPFAYLLICSEQSSFIPGKSSAPTPELSPVVQSVMWVQQTLPDIPALLQQLTRTWVSFVLELACLCWFPLSGPPQDTPGWRLSGGPGRVFMLVWTQRISIPQHADPHLRFATHLAPAWDLNPPFPHHRWCPS
jgi:hypothetical protein